MPGTDRSLVTYTARAYAQNHGTLPRGREGRWGFALDADPMEVLNGDPRIFWFSGSFARAKRAALAEAARRGARQVAVMP